ncbi:hypothetical protein VCHENC02_4235A, partial [Vibrio harveyi]
MIHLAIKLGYNKPY